MGIHIFEVDLQEKYPIMRDQNYSTVLMSCNNDSQEIDVEASSSCGKAKKPKDLDMQEWLTALEGPSRTGP